jgi:hypothetical protein
MHAEESPLVGQAPTPGFISSVASNVSFTDHISCRTELQSQSSVLPLLQWDDWDIHYAIEWKVTVNSRMVS